EDDFAGTLAAAVVATEQIESVVFDTPSTHRPTRPGPAAFVGETHPAPARVQQTGPGQWEVAAATLPEALAAARGLGQIQVGDAAQVSRGFGPCRSTEFVITVRRAAQDDVRTRRSDPGPATEGSGGRRQEPVAGGAAMLEQLLAQAGVAVTDTAGPDRTSP